jgi:tetratricopeptide (TPR) repeat protein
VRAVLAGPSPSPRAREPRCPRELAAIVERALARERAARYPDARALAGDLSAFLTGGLVGAHRYGWFELGRRWVRRHAAALAAVAALLAVGAGAWWYRGLTQARAAAAEEAARVTAVVAAADALLAEVAAGGAGENWLDVYAFKLVALREPAVEARLRDALAHPVDDVRRLAARALGGLRSRASVDALVARLGAEGERSPEVVVELVNALGVIGDPRAEGPVARARFAAGQGSPVWRRTELAYRMIPLPPLPADGAGVGFDALLERGRALDNKGDHAAAVAVYSRALELEPRSAAACNDRALARRALHDLEGALADYDRAPRSRPATCGRSTNRALVRKALDDHAGALADYDRVIKEGSLGALPLRNRARARVYVGDYAGALADAEAALRLEPGSAVGHSALASVHLSRNNWEQTQAALDRALAIDPGDPYALTLRATVAHCARRPGAARSDLESRPGGGPGACSRRASPGAARASATGTSRRPGACSTARSRGTPRTPPCARPARVLLAPSLRDPTATLRDLDDRALAREGTPGARAELRALRAGLELEAGRADAARATLAGLPAGPGGR